MIALKSISQAQISQIIKFPVGTVVPDFKIVDQHGVSHTLYQYTKAGKYVILDFFEWKCGPCKLFSPVLDQFYKKYGCNAYDVVAIGIEAFGNTANLQTYLADCKPPVKLDDSYPTAIGLTPGSGEKVTSLYGVSSWPSLPIIGPDNKVFNQDIWLDGPGLPLTVAKIEAKFPVGAIHPHPCKTTDIAETASESNVSIYPSPAMNTVTIEINNAANILHLNVLDVIGKHVISESINNINKYELDVSQLNNGVYFIEINTDLGKMTKKFIKN